MLQLELRARIRQARRASWIVSMWSFSVPFFWSCTPILPISGWIGDNLLKKSTNMPWWNGVDIVVQDQKKGTEKLHIETIQDALNDMARPPVRPVEAAMRLPVSGIYKIKGVGDVIAGRVEQGMVKPGEEVIFLPTHS